MSRLSAIGGSHSSDLSDLKESNTAHKTKPTLLKWFAHPNKGCSQVATLMISNNPKRMKMDRIIFIPGSVHCCVNCKHKPKHNHPYSS